MTCWPSPAANIEAWLSDLRTAGLSDATLRSRWVALRSLYRWLVEEDELEVSPLAKVMVAKGEAPPISVLEDDQLRLLLKACEGKDFYARRDLAMIRLFLATGLRKSELAAIAVEDLDLAARIVVVATPKAANARGRRASTRPPPAPSTVTSGSGPATAWPPTPSYSWAVAVSCPPTGRASSSTTEPAERGSATSTPTSCGTPSPIGSCPPAATTATSRSWEDGPTPR